MERNELEELHEIHEDIEMVIVFLVTGEKDIESALHHASQALNTVRKMIDREKRPIPDIGDWVKGYGE